MSVPNMNKTMVFLTTFMALSACSQNPQFKMNSANQVYQAGNDLHILLAKADLDAFQRPSSYATNIENYAAVIGGFEVGRQVAVFQSRFLAPSKAVKLDTLDSDIAGCLVRIKQMAKLHSTSGIDASSSITEAVRSSCDKAVRSVAANETSAWIVTTAADDL
jgi:hypothetical protein